MGVGGTLLENIEPIEYFGRAQYSGNIVVAG
jgi:hypothetical protein